MPFSIPSIASTRSIETTGQGGFYSIDVGFRIGPIYRLNVIVTDFVGKDPYRDVGLFRDRDEIATNFTVLF